MRRTDDVAVLAHDTFGADVLAGLSANPKTLPSRWLYDARGSELFEEITRLDEYYPTRTETRILRAHAGELEAFLGQPGALIEYGAGAGVKTEILLSALPSLQMYVPIDIAAEALADSAARIQTRHRQLRVLPIVADFARKIALPGSVRSLKRTGFFPGSTIGNLNTQEAVQFLQNMAVHVGAQGTAVLGMDLKKDRARLLRAYDDSAGVTASFNLNLLMRINRELSGTFELDTFRHEARWNDDECAIEMHLVSTLGQSVNVLGRRFRFAKGESIHTESSRKYDARSITDLATAAGWTVSRIWVDKDDQFAVVGVAIQA